jgi:hypothetical protein
VEPQRNQHGGKPPSTEPSPAAQSVLLEKQDPYRKGRPTSRLAWRIKLAAPPTISMAA